jgi:hypothetical protein
MREEINKPALVISHKFHYYVNTIYGRMESLSESGPRIFMFIIVQISSISSVYTFVVLFHWLFTYITCVVMSSYLLFEHDTMRHLPDFYVHFFSNFLHFLSALCHTFSLVVYTVSCSLIGLCVGGGGHTRLLVRGWGSPNSDDLRKSLALCYSVLYPISSLQVGCQIMHYYSILPIAIIGYNYVVYLRLPSRI